MCGQLWWAVWGPGVSEGADTTQEQRARRTLLHQLGSDFPRSSLLTTKIQSNLLPCSSSLPELSWATADHVAQQEQRAKAAFPCKVCECHRARPGGAAGWPRCPPHPLRVCAHQPNPECGLELSFLQKGCRAHPLPWALVHSHRNLTSGTSEISDLSWGVNLDGPLLQYTHGILQETPCGHQLSGRINFFSMLDD